MKSYSMKGLMPLLDKLHALGIIYPYKVFAIGSCACWSLTAHVAASIFPSVIMLCSVSLLTEPC